MSQSGTRARASTSRRRTAYGAPEAPVIARTSGAALTGRAGGSESGGGPDDWVAPWVGAWAGAAPASAGAAPCAARRGEESGTWPECTPGESPVLVTALPGSAPAHEGHLPSSSGTAAETDHEHQGPPPRWRNRRPHPPSFFLRFFARRAGHSGLTRPPAGPTRRRSRRRGVPGASSPAPRRPP